MVDRETLRTALGDAPRAGDEARAYARARLERHIAQAQTQLGTSRRSERTARRRRWRAAVLVTAAALAAAILILRLSADFGNPTAADALERVADRAARGFGSTGPLPPNGFWYTRARVQALRPASGGASGLVARTGEVEQWRAQTGAVRYVATGNVEQIVPSSSGRFPSPIGALTYAEAQALPADPHALLARIRIAADALRASAGRGGGSVARRRRTEPLAATEIMVLGDVLNDLPLTADVRAALFRAAALIPDVRVESGTDPTGRPGMAIVASGTSPVQGVSLAVDSEVLVEPATSALLAVETVTATPNADLGLPRGAIVDATVFVASGIVGSDTARLP